MTPEEAKEHIEAFEKFYRNTKDPTAVRIIAPYMVLEDFCVAIDALEKQVPKEPTVEVHDYCGEDYVTRKVAHEMCPGCHRVLSFGCAMRWCMYCGQKIDWSKLR